MKQTLLIFATALIMASCGHNDQSVSEHKDMEGTPIIMIPHAVTDIDGNCYAAIQVGHQLWMAENLRVTKDHDGHEIALGNEISLDKPYRYNPTEMDSNMVNLGYLYNWEAAVRVCPKGWHLPTYDEWTGLADYVGSQSQFRCEDKDWKIAKSLASREMWNDTTLVSTVGNSPNSNDSTGFCALPAGRYDGKYDGMGRYAFFWNTTENDREFAYFCALHFDNAGLGHTFTYKSHGLSVRCVKEVGN